MEVRRTLKFTFSLAHDLRARVSIDIDSRAFDVTWYAKKETDVVSV